MTPLCIGIGDEVIPTTVAAATTYMQSSTTGSMTAGRALISAATLCPHVDAGGGRGGEGGGAGGSVGNEVAK